MRVIVTDRILQEAGFESRLREHLAAIERPSGVDLAAGINRMFKQEPEREWRDHVVAVVNTLTSKS